MLHTVQKDETIGPRVLQKKFTFAFTTEKKSFIYNNDSQEMLYPDDTASLVLERSICDSLYDD
jgi:hypothetical protein